MELALSVIGQKASCREQWKSLGFRLDRGGEAGGPRSFLVHFYLDHRAMAEVARGSRDRKSVSSGCSACRRYGE
jgi:hypothetical protein